jgi:hypothetical protein
LLPDAFAQVVTMSPSPGTLNGPVHQTHFFAALGQQGGPAFVMNKLIVLQLDTFPIASSSGGFAFNYDAGSGLFKPASKSFGPSFAERALTNGKGRFGFGFNFQSVRFDSFEGVGLNSGQMTYQLQHNDCCPAPAGITPGPDEPAFESDLIAMSPVVSIKSSMVTPYVSYGLTNRWDVSAVIPIVKVDLATTVTAVINRLGSTDNPLIHSWDGAGSTVQVTSLSGAATGLGDIALRTKYRFLDADQGGGIAAAIDLRLPTGDKEKLLGTGATRTKLLFIASGEFSHFSPHVNVGYTFSHGELSSATTQLPPTTAPANTATQIQINNATGVSLGGDLKVPNEFNYTGGFDIAAHALLTISADFVGRTVFDVERFDTISQTFQYRASNTAPLQSITEPNFVTTGTGNLNLVLGVVGAKFNIPGTSLLITGSVLFPITDGGLKPKVTPVIGLDYSFRK